MNALKTMTLDEQAAALVSQVDPQDVAALLSEYPEPEDIEIGTLEPERRTPLPSDLKLRCTALRDEIERCRQKLEGHIERYNHLRSRGLAAVSQYDILISSGGDPLKALRTALRLKHAHISNALTMGHSLQMELAKTLQALGEAPQLALF